MFSIAIPEQWPNYCRHSNRKPCFCDVMSQRANRMSVTLLWILQSERVEVKILFVRDILSPISDCQKGNLLHLWVCSSYTQFHSERSNVWGSRLSLFPWDLLCRSRILYYCSRIEISLFLIFYLLNAPFPGMFLKQDAWKQIIKLKSSQLLFNKDCKL